MITDWIHEIIDGSGGLHDFEDHEIATSNVSRDEVVAAWTIRCLANLKCEGSANALQEIIKRRYADDITINKE